MRDVAPGWISAFSKRLVREKKQRAGLPVLREVGFLSCCRRVMGVYMGGREICSSCTCTGKEESARELQCR